MPMLTIDDIKAELERGELAAAREALNSPSFEAQRDALVKVLLTRLDVAYEQGDYSLLTAASRDAAMPESVRSRACSHLFSLDHKPAGDDHRKFLRQHGIRSIDDIDD